MRPRPAGSRTIARLATGDEEEGAARTRRGDNAGRGQGWPDRDEAARAGADDEGENGRRRQGRTCRIETGARCGWRARPQMWKRGWVPSVAGLGD
jgi:hypothetical protein